MTLAPPDEDYKLDAYREFAHDILNKSLLLNVEYRLNGFPFATLSDPASNLDIGKGLVADGFLIVDKVRERRVSKLVSFLAS